jgi:C-terminal processing protease CtpA/Prc
VALKPHVVTFLVAIVAGVLGGVSSQLYNSESTGTDQPKAEQEAASSLPVEAQSASSDRVVRIAQLEQKVESLEAQLATIVNDQAANMAEQNDTQKVSSEALVDQVRVASPKDELVSVGVNPQEADDILRRISEQQYRRMELANLVRRNTSSDSRAYITELRELGQNQVSLRSELGDEAYEEYLMKTGQNNRVKVSTVMAGSPAEVIGLQSEDIIVSYGGQNIVTSDDIQHVELDGEIGSVTEVEILRDGSRINLTVPRGVLGVQLDAIQHFSGE